MPTAGNFRSRLALALTAIIIAACASTPPAPVAPAAPAAVPGAKPVPPPAEPPKPQVPPTTSTNPGAKVNLQGFPLPYRQGYADGCASIGATEQKDAARFKSDGQYRTGWVDGNALCKKH